MGDSENFLLQGIVNKQKTELLRQIGHYGYDGVPHYLSTKAQGILNAGIPKYREAHKKEVHQYKEKHHIKGTSTLDDPQFFRKEFIKYLSGSDGKNKHAVKAFDPKGTTFDPTGASILSAFRESNGARRERKPESATISLEDLLGSKGAKLYKLALREEAHSIEFRHAVTMKATAEYEGPKWKERPVLFVGGPSASGKSYAAQSAVRMATRFLKTDDSTVATNRVLAADGGDVREMSQMRKLTVQLATALGYSGVKDIHSKSKGTLEKIKHYVREAGLEDKQVGVVIPETFSKWSADRLKDFKAWVKGVFVNDSKKNTKNTYIQLMERIKGMDNTKLIFTRVDGEEPSVFQKVVAFMGSRRAWKTKGFERSESLDLNKTDVIESKAYDGGVIGENFYAGKVCSEWAEQWYCKNTKVPLNMTIINELILIKPDKTNPQKDWHKAEQSDAGATLIPRREYEKWKKIPLATRPELIIKLIKDGDDWRAPKAGDEIEAKKAKTIYGRIYEEWQKLPSSPDKPKIGLVEYQNAQIKPIIRTSSQIDLAIAQKLIRQKIDAIEVTLKAEDIKAEENKDWDKINALVDKITLLSTLADVPPETLETEAGRGRLRKLVDDYQSAMPAQKTSWRSYFSSSLDSSLELLNSALKKAKREFTNNVADNTVSADVTTDFKAKLRSDMHSSAPEEDIGDKQDDGCHTINL